MGGLDIKRTVMTLALISAIWIVWMKFFLPRPAPQAPPPAPAATSPAPQGAGPASPVAAAPPAGAPPAPAGTSASKSPEAARPPEQRVVLETKDWRATFSNWGGALASFELKDPQYREKIGRAEGGLDLVKTAPHLPLFTSFEESGFQIPPDAAWEVESSTPTEVRFAWQNDEVSVVKRFQPDLEARHVLTMIVEVTNRGGAPLAEHLQVYTYARHDFEQKSGFGRPAPNIWMPSCYVDGKTQKKAFDALKEKGPLEAMGDLRWAGVQDRYFLLAVAPPPDPQHNARACRATIGDPAAGLIETKLLMPEQRVAPGQTAAQSLVVYAGPKILGQLDAVKAGGQDAKLGDAVDYGWWSPISRVMLLILVGVHRGVGSWGVAIIALTLLVKVLTYPLTQKSMKSAKEMAKLKPEMEKLQKRHKGDKQRLNQEVMGLYKSHGVNPLGGCLPMLIQFPIWWALYATLGNAVELYRSKFLWMPDLTQADPYKITPIAMGIFMFVQQRITPMPTDSEQQKMMMYMMPVVFTVMSLWFPSGLTVYILTNTLLTMVQQWWMNRSGGQKVLKPARAS